MPSKEEIHDALRGMNKEGATGLMGSTLLSIFLVGISLKRSEGQYKRIFSGTAIAQILDCNY